MVRGNLLSRAAIAGLAVLASVTAGHLNAKPLDNPLPDDFAYGAEVILPHSLPLQSLALPAVVYRQQTQANGADVRIFNADGIAVAMDRQVLEAVDSEPRLTPISLFPLKASQLSDTAGIQLAINRDAGRTEIQLSDSEVTEETNLVAYVVALPENWLAENRQLLRGLTFEWRQPEQGFIEKLRIETSTDLLNWREWIENESLSRLTWNQQQIGKSRIDISSRQRNRAQRYWRISWQTGQEVELTALQLVLQESLQRDDQGWVSVKHLWQPVEESTSIVELHNRDKLPVTGFKFLPAKGNGFLSGQLYSRQNERDEWRWRGEVRQYRLQIDKDKHVESNPLEVSSRQDEFWRLELARGMSADQLKQWNITMSWTPKRLTFVREGSEPFLLAWGNPNVTRVNSDLKGLYEALTPKQQRQLIARKARIGQPKTLGGEIKLRPPMPFGWQQVALWGSLLLGVIALFWMARGLYRQMAEDKA